MSLVIQNWNKAMGIPQGCYICRKWDHENPTLKLWTNFFFCMLCPFGMFPLCLSHFSCHSSVGGIGRRFMSQGEHLSVTDQPVLLWWQVSPSPLWCLSSPTLIKSQCLAKCGVGTHLLPERPSNNWGLIGDPYSKLRGGFGSQLEIECRFFISSICSKRLHIQKKKCETFMCWAQKFICNLPSLSAECWVSLHNPLLSQIIWTCPIFSNKIMSTPAHTNTVRRRLNSLPYSPEWDQETRW